MNATLKRIFVILAISAMLVGSSVLVAVNAANNESEEPVGKEIASTFREIVKTHQNDIENLFLLKTEEDVTIFQQYMAEFEAEKQVYLSDFSTKTAGLVSRASVITGRGMSAENPAYATYKETSIIYFNNTSGRVCFLASVCFGPLPHPLSLL